METSYPLDDNFTTNGVNITEEIKSYLYETAKWGKFLSIVAFVFIALIVVFMLFMLFAGGAAMMSGFDEAGAMAGMGMGFMIVIYGLMIAMYFFPTLYLYRFSTKMKVALDSNDQQTLSESFMNMKSVFKFWGIFTAIFIGFYAVMIVGSLLMGGMGMLF